MNDNEVLRVGNNIRTTLGGLAAMVILCILAGFPGASIGADGAMGKPEIKTSSGDRKNPYAEAEITIRILHSASRGFGYEILLHGRPFVHQPHIPGLPGNEGFATSERARKVAEFVVRKIRNHEMPPTVTIEDLNRLGVLK